MGHGDRGLLVLVLLALAAGCADLPDVAGGECGNRVLEPGEDCDGFTAFAEGTACAPADDADNACHYVCEAATCPAGWGCGADGRCRQFGGWFDDTGTPWEFEADDFAIGDIDGDGIPDLLGNDDSSLTARFGAGDGTLPATLKVLGREPTGPVTYTQFDSDARLDAVVPTASGLFVVRGQEGRALEPVAYSPFDLDLEGSFRIAAMESEPDNPSTEVLMVRSAIIGERAALHFVGSSVLPLPFPVNLPADQLADQLPVADLDGDGRAEVALSFIGDRRVWIYTSTGDAENGGNTLAPALWQQVDAGAPIQHGVLFADVNLDGRTDLLTSTGSTPDTTATVVLYANASDGSLGPPTPLPAFDQAGSPLPLAVASPVYVYAYALYIAYWNGVQGTPPDGLFPVAYPPTNSWKEAAFGDFNGDGDGDFAAIIDGREGVDISLNAGNGLFNRFHVDSNQPARGLRVGDFDGDLVADVAFIDDGQGVTADGLSVIFGAASAGPSAAVSMGRTGTIEAMEPVFAAGALEAADGVTDLFVVSASWPDLTTRAVAMMLGGASRRLISPFTLVSDPLAPFPDVPLRALVGDIDGDGIRDVGAIAARFWSDAQADPLGTRDLFYGIPGRGDAGDLDASGVAIVPMTELAFDSGCALWASGDVDGDGLPELVGVDGTLTCAATKGGAEAPRLMVAGVGETSLDAAIGPLAGELRLVVDLELEDMDADGDLDLMVLAVGDVFDPIAGPDAGRGLQVWWNDGSGTFASPAAVSLDGTSWVVDASPLPLAPATPAGVVLFADAGTMIARQDPDAAHTFLPAESVFWATGEGRVRAGDLDRDGVVDLAVGDRSHVYVLLGHPAPPLGGDLGGDGTIVEPPVGQ